jgi:hypothetical protein
LVGAAAPGSSPGVGAPSFSALRSNTSVLPHTHCTQVSRFFDLPLPAKMALSPPERVKGRGDLPMGIESVAATLSGATPPDLCEALVYASLHRERAGLGKPNFWPVGLTILRQDDAPGGLQVCDAQDRWADVPPMPGTFVINPPRAATGSTRRLSLVPFTGPEEDTEVACLPSCQGPGRQRGLNEASERAA